MGRVYHRERRGREEATIQRGEGGDENVILRRIVSYYIYIYHIICWLYMAYCIISYIMLSKDISHIIYFRSYHIILEHIQLYCIISCNIMPYHIMFAWYMYISHSISNFVIVLYCIVLYCIDLCCNKSCHVRMLYDIISLAYNMCLGHIISCYIISNNVVRPYCIIMKK